MDDARLTLTSDQTRKEVIGRKSMIRPPPPAARIPSDSRQRIPKPGAARLAFSRPHR